MYFVKGYYLLYRGCIIGGFLFLGLDYKDDVMGVVCVYDMIDCFYFWKDLKIKGRY